MFSLPIAGIVTIVVLVTLSAFFSSTESAVFTLPETWLSEQDATADGRVETLRSLREDSHRLLVTILVGNNVVTMAIASITTALLTNVLPAGSAVTAATVVASFVVAVFDVLPRHLNSIAVVRVIPKHHTWMTGTRGSECTHVTAISVAPEDTMNARRR